MSISVKNNINHIKSEKEMMQESVYQDNRLKCPECNSDKIIRDDQRAQNYCGNCGIVIEEDIIDVGPEWRAFDHSQAVTRTRVGAPTTFSLHDKGLTTTMDKRDKDANGRNISSNKARWRRLRSWNNKSRISNPRERNLAFALGQLDRYSSTLGIPRSVREEASILYRSAVDAKLIRGRSIEGVVAASLYAACRQAGIPRTLGEIEEVTPVSKKELGRTYRFLSKELQFKLSPTSPIDYVPRFVSRLDLSGEVESKAIELIKKAIDKDMTSGKAPTGIAAAAIYISSILLGERKTQKEVADASGVTEVTIRNRYTELTEQLEMGVIL